VTSVAKSAYAIVTTPMAGLAAARGPVATVRKAHAGIHMTGVRNDASCARRNVISVQRASQPMNRRLQVDAPTAVKSVRTTSAAVRSTANVDRRWMRTRWAVVDACAASWRQSSTTC
jgi:hypothetical protein